MSTAGEGGPAVFNGQIPNDGVALYGPDAAYRLRVLTTGGFSPDGVRSVYPTEFSRYFRVQAVDAAGHEHLDRAGGAQLRDQRRHASPSSASPTSAWRRTATTTPTSRTTTTRSTS